MKFTRKIFTTSLLFYLLMVYVVMQFGWWFWLMLSLQQELALVQDLSEELARRKIFMVLGEGLVFLLLLLLGAAYIIKAFRREIKLAERQQNFLLSVTHELKTPITTILLAMETLLRRKSSDDEVDKMAKMSISEAKRLESLINNLLLSAREETGKVEDITEIDMTSFLEEIVQADVSESDQNRILLNVATSTRWMSSPQLLKNIVIQLVDNALKYSDESVKVSCYNDATSYVLEVADEGVGISEKEKKLIFKLFYRGGLEMTRKKKGTGVGLYLAINLAKTLGASLKVKDNVPRGTIFVLRIPFRKKDKV